MFTKAFVATLGVMAAFVAVAYVVGAHDVIVTALKERRP